MAGELEAMPPQRWRLTGWQPRELDDLSPEAIKLHQRSLDAEQAGLPMVAKDKGPENAQLYACFVLQLSDATLQVHSMNEPHLGWMVSLFHTGMPATSNASDNKYNERFS